MPYWQLFYHVVWGTKNREPVLTENVESILHEFIRVKAIGLGAVVYSINGWLDHVHVITSIPPSISVSKFIGQIKAVATSKFNKSTHSQTPIYWQDAYSVFTFDRKRLPYHIKYVNRQKEHHTKGSLISLLERSGGQGVNLVSEPREIYQTEYIEWFSEMNDTGSV